MARIRQPKTDNTLISVDGAHPSSGGGGLRSFPGVGMPALRFGVQGLPLRVQDLGFGFCGVQGSGFRVQGLGFGVQGSEFRV